MFKRYLSDYDPKYEQKTDRNYTDYLRIFCEDGFDGHPLGSNSVVVRDCYPENGTEIIVVNIIRNNKLNMINYGWNKHGFAINFRTPEHAALFRLFYTGETLPGNDFKHFK